MSEKNGTNFNNLKEMILLEEFKSCVHPSISNYITEHKAPTLQKVSEMADEFFLSHKHIFQKSSQSSTFKRNFYNEKNTSRFNNSSSDVNTSSNTSHKQNNPGSSKYTSRDSSQNPSSTESSSQDKMPSVFCTYCKRQGHVISGCPVLKARKESKPVVAYTSAEYSFKQDFMPSGFSYCPQMGNELYLSPPSKDFTCSFLTSGDYVPLSGDSMPVHLDLMPVHQDLTPLYQDSMPVHHNLTPVYQDSTHVLQDLTSACQDFMPVCQDSTPVYQDSTPVYQDFVPV